MIDIQVNQMPGFKRSYKKLHKSQKEHVNKAILEIVKDPELGEEKKGDLSGVYVYKFRMENKEFLLAYEWEPKSRLLIALGVHENFYRDLKRIF